MKSSALRALALNASILAAVHLSGQTAPKLDQAFQRLDADKDGKLSQAEFDKLRTQLKVEHPPEAWRSYFRSLDADGDGALKPAEYRAIGKKGRPDAAGPKPAGRPSEAAHPAFSAQDLAFFETNIRPVLVKTCYECHSADSKELKAGLALDARAAILKGGDSGKAAIPGRPEASLLIKSLTHADPDLKMPPDKHGGRLSDGVIENFSEWVRRGLPMPEGKTIGVEEKMAARLDHWAFHAPVDRPAPGIKDPAWPWTEVDRFILAELERKDLRPVADAEPSALIRRIYLDLTGLPPTAEQLNAFLSAPTRQSAEATIDKLLQSPLFGERWGRHWLDVARFAESSGKETDFAYPHAWRYRDYVIDAFNKDIPFNRFIREQIAGDLLEAKDGAERARLLIATGFLAIGPKSHIERNPRQFEMDVVDDQIDVISQGFLGLTMSCARCHDHKYEPVSQRDYYALAGIFRSTEASYGTVDMVQNNNPSKLLPMPEGAGQPDGVPQLTARERRRLEESIAQKSARIAELTKKREFASPEFVQTRLRLVTDKAHLDAFLPDGTPKQQIIGVNDRKSHQDANLLQRGEVQKPGDLVPRELPMLAKPAAPIAEGSGRKELAEWVASPDNPLTPRVIVNRIWLQLFGEGLVRSPDNFGLSGQKPSLPELLDHLAVQFVKNGWSVKKLVRELMLSRTYGLGTALDAKNFEADPDNSLLWRTGPRRLSAEVIRDAMMFTAGRLDLKAPVGSAIGSYGEGYVVGANTRQADQTSTMRSVYLPMARNIPLESLALFDMTSSSVVTGKRAQTTVPAQSLFLLNSPYVLKNAEAAAKRLLADRPNSEPHRIKLAYQRIFGRSPTEAETAAALTFVNSKADKSRGWAALCQSMWASHEFLYRN